MILLYTLVQRNTTVSRKLLADCGECGERGRRKGFSRGELREGVWM